MSHKLNLNGLEVTVDGPPWLQGVLGLVTLGLYIWSLFWIARDAHKRGKDSSTAVFFAILAVWPLSMLWWLWLRPRFSPSKVPPPLSRPKPPALPA
jgi:hypothetical protein